MSYDLVFGKIKRDWSLGGMTDEVDTRFTEEESAMLAKAADLKAKAESGDKDAKKKLAVFTRGVAALKAKANKGDAKAKRVLSILRDSGIFNPTQTLAVTGWNPFAAKPEGMAERIRRQQQFAKDIASVTKPEEIAKLSQIITTDPALKEQAGVLARAGNPIALKIVSYKTETAGSFVGRATPAQRRAKRQRHLQQLKSRAAAGDQKAVARLRQMQVDLGLPATTPIPGVATIPGTTALPASSIPPAGLTLAQIQRYYPAYAATLARTQPASYGPYAPYAQAYPTSSYQPAPQSSYQPAPQSSYQPAPQYDYENPYEEEAIDVYQGDDMGRRGGGRGGRGRGGRGRRGGRWGRGIGPAWYIDDLYDLDDDGPVVVLPSEKMQLVMGEEEAALAGDGGACERAALNRTSSCGEAIPNKVYRSTILKQALRTANGKRPSTRDFFLAKATVDKVIGKAGISLFLPGAQPGRRTI